MASAGPYASLHLAPDTQPHQHPVTQFFTCRMPFLPPNQQRQSTEGLTVRNKRLCYVMLCYDISITIRFDNIVANNTDCRDAQDLKIASNDSGRKLCKNRPIVPLFCSPSTQTCRFPDCLFCNRNIIMVHQ